MIITSEIIMINKPPTLYYHNYKIAIFMMLCSIRLKYTNDTMLFCSCAHKRAESCTCECQPQPHSIPVFGGGGGMGEWEPQSEELNTKNVL